MPEVVQGINAFALGMQAANPKASVRVLWLNTWFDPAREREAALALINAGADVLTNHSASAAVPQAAEEKGVKLIAYQSDMRAQAPTAQLAAVTADWSGYYTRVAQSVIAGTLAGAAGVGRHEGRHGQAGGGVASAAGRWCARNSRRARPCSWPARPRRSAAGWSTRPARVRNERGALSDEAIARMDWFVRGVSGTLPRP